MNMVLSLQAMEDSFEAGAAGISSIISNNCCNGQKEK